MKDILFELFGFFWFVWFRYRGFQKPDLVITLERSKVFVYLLLFGNLTSEKLILIPERKEIDCQFSSEGKVLRGK